MSPSPATTALDPITYEVISHRLWSINEEGSTTIVHASGLAGRPRHRLQLRHLRAPNGDWPSRVCSTCCPIFVCRW